MFAEKRDHALKFVRKAINLIHRAGETEARSRRTGHVVVAMQRLAAVMTTADANARQIEHGGDVIGMHALNQEGG